MSKLPKDAYVDGIEAGWRTGKYEGIAHAPPCPYPPETPECKAWWIGFGDATEDMLFLAKLD